MTDDTAARPREATRILVDLQDEVLAAVAELERLDRLLEDAAGQLLPRFVDARSACRDAAPDAAALAQRVDAPLRDAMTALQFQDLSSQLLAHARCRLATVADCLGDLALPDDAGREPRWPRRSSPVAQRAIAAGSVELF